MAKLTAHTPAYLSKTFLTLLAIASVALAKDNGLKPIAQSGGPQSYYHKVYRIAASPNGNLVAAAREHEPFSLWLPGQSKKLNAKGSDRPEAEAIAISPRGNLMASSGSSSPVHLWTLQPFKSYRILKSTSKNGYADLAFSPRGDYLAAAGFDHAIHLWEITNRNDRTKVLEAIRLDGHKGAVRKVVFSPNGNRMASCSDDKTIRIWDMKAKAILSVLRGHTQPVNAICFLTNKKLISTANEPGARIYNVQTTKGQTYFEKELSHIQALAPVPGQNERMVAASPGMITFFNPYSRKIYSRMNRKHLHEGSITAIALSPNGKYLYTGGDEGAIKQWKISTLLTQQTKRK